MNFTIDSALSELSCNGGVTVDSCMGWCRNQHYYFNNDYLPFLLFGVIAVYIELLFHVAFDYFVKKGKIPEHLIPHTRALILYLRIFTIALVALYLYWNRFHSGNFI